jgi:hypothetical protein
MVRHMVRRLWWMSYLVVPIGLFLKERDEQAKAGQKAPSL